MQNLVHKWFCFFLSFSLTPPLFFQNYVNFAINWKDHVSFLYCKSTLHSAVLYIHIPLMQNDTNFNLVAQIRIHNFYADVSVCIQLMRITCKFHIHFNSLFLSYLPMKAKDIRRIQHQAKQNKFPIAAESFLKSPYSPISLWIKEKIT